MCKNLRRRPPLRDGDDLAEVVVEVFLVDEQHRPSNQGSYYKWNKPDVVAAGEVFPEDQILHPNEAITTSIVFYLPQDSYDLVRVHLELPTTPVANSAEVIWTVTPANGCEAQVYRKN